MHKAWYWIGGITVACFIYNLDAITGQWKFEKLCKEEGGPRYFEPVEKDVGWEVLGSSESDYKIPFAFEHVKFVRWKNEKGESFDVYVDWEIRKLPYPRRSEYILKPSDMNDPVNYRYSYESIKFPDDPRFSRYQTILVNLKTNQVAATYTEFGYAWTTSDRVIFAAPTLAICWRGETVEMQKENRKFLTDVFTRGDEK